jgi:hypothetical protein
MLMPSNVEHVVEAFKQKPHCNSISGQQNTRSNAMVRALQILSENVGKGPVVQHSVQAK